MTAWAKAEADIASMKQGRLHARYRLRPRRTRSVPCHAAVAPLSPTTTHMARPNGEAGIGPWDGFGWTDDEIVPPGHGAVAGGSCGVGRSVRGQRHRSPKQPNRETAAHATWGGHSGRNAHTCSGICPKELQGLPVVIERVSLALVALLMLSVSAAMAGPWEDGASAYQHGDYSMAFKWFQLAAARGDVRAQFNIGSMYENGRGVSRDTEEATKWYLLAAEQGDPGAQTNLGLIHENAVGQDYEQAVKWFRLAAEQGYAAAQTNLGVMYEKGHGVPQDYAKAIVLYRQAATQRHQIALYNLGSLYETGKGVEQNFVRAHMWFNLAGAAGYAPGEQRRDIVANKMTAQQIAEAQQLSLECRLRNFRRCD
jgi:uncharacterized protein